MDAALATRSRQIGASLVENGLITSAQLDQALQQQERTGEPLGEIVMAEFGVSQGDLSRALAEHRHTPVGTELRERLGLIPLQQVADSQPLTPVEVRLRRPIGEIFVELGFITQGQLEGALAVQKTTGARIGEILVEQGILTRLDLASALAEHWESGQPTTAAAGPSLGNGAPVTPPPEPRRVVEDDAVILEPETRLELAEGGVEPIRPPRRLWRRSRRSSAAEGIPSPAQTDEGAEDPATPGDLEGEIADLGRVLTPLEALAVLEQSVATLAATTVELGAELQALTERPAVTELGQQLPELAQRVESIEAEGRERIGRLAEELRADVQSRVAELASELGAQQEESVALREGLHDRVGSVEASLAQRLERIEERLAADDRAELNAVVTELGCRLDQQAAIGEEQARASERAIREGLASLGERLTGFEPTLSAKGKGPGPIERLAAAVVTADASMADRDPVSIAEGFVAFAPTASGYRLVELPGGPPEIGSMLELDVCDGPLVVTRHGRSPLPFDGRPCAYLGRV